MNPFKIWVTFRELEQLLKNQKAGEEKRKKTDGIDVDGYRSRICLEPWTRPSQVKAQLGTTEINKAIVLVKITLFFF